MNIQVICGVITTICTLIWIVNQLCWYSMFKKYFDRQEEVMHYQVELNDLHKTLLDAQIHQMGWNKIDHKSDESCRVLKKK